MNLTRNQAQNHGPIIGALGVDIGNVIIDARRTGFKRLTEAEYAALPPTEGVFVALKTLNERFAGKVYLVSKCNEWAEVQIHAWLTAHDFYAKTGILQANIHFVRERHEKDAVCQKLGVTHFIDDRLEVLSHMIDSTPNLFLYRPDKDEVNEFKEYLSKVYAVGSWQEILEQMGK